MKSRIILKFDKATKVIELVQEEKHVGLIKTR